MARDSFPWRDDQWVGWSANFAAKIVATPGALGISPEQAAEYDVVRETYTAAYLRTQDPSTNSDTARQAKKMARKQLEDQSRMLGRIIRARPGITAEVRVGLGLSEQNGGGKSPRIPAPDAAPIVRVAAVVGRTVKVRLVNRQSPTRRGKPRGVGRATLWKYAGENPPADENGWQFAGTSPVATVDVAFEDASLPPGTKVWIMARWENKCYEPGPGCEPVYAYLSGGVAMAA